MTITWEQILAFLCEDQSMAVTSLLFIAFFVAVALVHYLLPRVLRPYFLLAASYGFFCYDPVNRPLVGVLLGATAVSWLPIDTRELAFHFSARYRAISEHLVPGNIQSDVWFTLIYP